MHELSQFSDTNFVTTRTQGHMTSTKGMGRHKVTNSQSKPYELKQYKISNYQTTFKNHIPSQSSFKLNHA